MSQTINWQNVLPFDGTQVATTCLKQLSEYFSGKLSPEDFRRENNYVYVGFQGALDGLKYKAQVSAPDTYAEMVGIRAKKGKDFDSTQYLKDHPEVSEYLARASTITEQNRTNACKLEDLCSYFTKLGDVVAAGKMRDVYKSYPVSLYQGANCIWKRRNL